MRFIVSLAVIPALLLTSCAYQGTIVQKESRPHPLYHSVGIESVDSFVLRDQAGTVHRQMVTPDVFEQYAEGEYFNDLQPPTGQANDHKAVRTATATAVKAAPRIASIDREEVGPIAKSKQVASKTKAAQRTRATPATESNTHVAQLSKERSAARKPVAVKAKGTANHRRVVKKEAKPWKMTEPTVETPPSSPEVPADPASPAEGPTEASPAAKPGASPEAAWYTPIRR